MMRSRIAAVACVAAAAAVAGCGGSSTSGERSSSPARSMKQQGLSFSGERVAGTIYVNAGQDQLNADLYRADGSLERVSRITRDGRVSIIAGSRDGRLAVANARGAGTDRLEFAALDRGGDVLPGEVIDSSGQAPSFSPGGKLLYVKPRYAPDGGEAGYRYYVTDSRGGSKKAVWSSGDEQVLLDWGPGEKLAAVYGGKPTIVVEPGGPSERRIDVPLSSVTSFLVNRDGAIAARDESRRVAVVPPAGEPKVFATRGVPLAWSPDGKSLLLLSEGTRLDVLTIADGSIRRVGRVDNGEIYGAAWVPGGK
jgi:hypothetical protein